jgi:hypothetical protein
MSRISTTPSAGETAETLLLQIAELLYDAAAPAQLPYGADNYALTYYGSTNNLHTMVFKQGTTTVKTRTFTYAAAGVANDDKLTAVADT